MSEDWAILPLRGKYYGTEVEVGHATAKVWDHSDPSPPSRRQLDEWGIEDWDALDPEERSEYTCDSHYETERDYQLAQRLISVPKLEAEVARLRAAILAWYEADQAAHLGPNLEVPLDMQARFARWVAEKRALEAIAKELM